MKTIVLLGLLLMAGCATPTISEENKAKIKQAIEEKAIPAITEKAKDLM
jgi:hypothetical protein